MDGRALLLDLHVLVTDKVPSAWVDQCLDSVDVAMERAPYRTQLHLHDAIMGDFWQARRNGYSTGSAPYVANVDLDDWLTADGLSSLEEGMLAGMDIVGNRGVQVDLSLYGHRVKRPTGVVAFKRALLDTIDWSNGAIECCPEHQLIRAVGQVAYSETVGKYVRRGYQSLGATIREEQRHGVA